MTGDAKHAPDDPYFVVAVGFARTDDDPRPISQISEAELLAGFGVGPTPCL
jgi:hypothetical protein